MSLRKRFQSSSSSSGTAKICLIKFLGFHPGFVLSLWLSLCVSQPPFFVTGFTVLDTQTFITPPKLLNIPRSRTRDCPHSLKMSSLSSSQQQQQQQKEMVTGQWKQCPVDLDTFVMDSPPFYTEEESYWSQEAYESSLELYHSFTSSNDTYVQSLIQDALHTLANAYRLYGPQNVIGSYNGGKDAVVIFHLMRAAHAKYYADLNQQSNNNNNKNNNQKMIRPRVIYFEHDDEFVQVEDFLKQTIQQFDCFMLSFPKGTGFSNGLKLLVNNNYPFPQNQQQQQPIPPYPMAFVLGTRSSDPNAGSQQNYAPSSHYMPPFMRVNPIIEFTYGHVWHFLRLFKLPYCYLYDQGYTSLGTTKDTFPCPALKKPSNDTTNDSNVDECQYWPAYMLRDWDQERAGRIKVDKKKKNPPTISQSSSTVSLTSQISNTNNNNTTKTATTKIKQADSTNQSNIAVNKVVSFSKKEDDTLILTPTNNDGTQTDAAKNNDDETLDSSFTNSPKTVGLIIIGDEILKGLTTDINTHAAAIALRKQNVPLVRTVVVSDDMDEIVNEIQRMQRQVDIIITSGGVGPTHDDVTIKSISNALGSELVHNEGMAALLRAKMENKSDELTPAQEKMATLPKCSKLRYLSDDKNDWPLLQCKNIFVLPGVPQYFENKIQTLAVYLSTELERGETFKVVLSIDENSIVPILNEVVKKHNNVSFGSYPFVDHPDCKTVVTLEGRRMRGGYERNSGRFENFTFDDDSIDTDDDKEEDTLLSQDEGGFQFSKAEMDKHVRQALTDLVEQMPTGSVLRVDNNDSLNFF